MLPTSLYIHIPWCIRKCPYCDFNSHKSPTSLPEQEYINALLADFKNDLNYFPAREINTIFIGGGTPSLFSAEAYELLFAELQQLVSFKPNIEITMEANPGTVEQHRFNAYRRLGINRLSLGIQSFNAHHLKVLGRIHDDQQAHRAIEAARLAGFENLNIDLMHGLPGQSLAQGLADLNTALTYQPEHLSWYQLTIEPNTLFYKQRPSLPNEDETSELEEQGLSILETRGYLRYEISAFCKPDKAAIHNMNYWQFGDYFGIGAGAHSKISCPKTKAIYRCRKQRQPVDYLNPDKDFIAAKELVNSEDLLFEFMLNLSRLEQEIPKQLFQDRTGLAFEKLEPKLLKAAKTGLIKINATSWQITPFGRRYTNNLQEVFLPD
ncbi:MAG: radical SAM family heme chaperone HemW [Tatlockia sp.]|nr:radical SAM family heme chaperone HemW [Tatlockia sp.]